jgi:hypothetical protein
MTFQNLLCRIPKWNEAITESETQRILKRSGCEYLEDLITCIHIVQLKTLTAIRVANKLKKIDISIPKLDQFIHKVYIFSARKLYTNVYLFERPTIFDHQATAAAAVSVGGGGSGGGGAGMSAQIQKHNREIELIINECILNAVRESIPIEEILRAYMDESVEVEEEIIIDPMHPPMAAAAAGGGGGSGNGSGIGGVSILPGAPTELDVEDLMMDRVDRSIYSTVPPLPPAQVGDGGAGALTIESLNDRPVKSTLKFQGHDEILETDNTLSLSTSSAAADAAAQRRKIDEILATVNHTAATAGPPVTTSASSSAVDFGPDDIFDLTPSPSPSPSPSSDVASNDLSSVTLDDIEIL